MHTPLDQHLVFTLTPRGSLKRPCTPTSQPPPPLFPTGLFLLNRQQNLRRHLGRGHPLRLPPRAEEVHQGHKDGVRRAEEAKGEAGSHRIFEG